MTAGFIPPSVVVGIDGSRAAAHAAVWAIDEAASREIPLRLIAVSSAGDGERSAQRLAEAARAVAAAADGRTVAVRTEEAAGEPTQVLLEASRTAAMVCVGAVGLKHFEPGRTGSTATALVASALCPVAVVRAPARSGGNTPGAVVVELDDTPDSAAVLQSGVAEARLRSAPLRVLGLWHSRYTDMHDANAVTDGNRLVRARLDRRLSQWKHRYPDLDVRPVPVHGSALNYLARHTDEIQLVVVGARDGNAVGELLGPTGSAVLHDTDCSVLVVDPQRLL